MRPALMSGFAEGRTCSHFPRPPSTNVADLGPLPRGALPAGWSRLRCRRDFPLGTVGPGATFLWDGTVEVYHRGHDDGEARRWTPG